MDDMSESWVSMCLCKRAMKFLMSKFSQKRVIYTHKRLSMFRWEMSTNYEWKEEKYIQKWDEIERKTKWHRVRSEWLSLFPLFIMSSFFIVFVCLSVVWHTSCPANLSLNAHPISSAKHSHWCVVYVCMCVYVRSCLLSRRVRKENVGCERPMLMSLNDVSAMCC